MCEKYVENLKNFNFLKKYLKDEKKQEIVWSNFVVWMYTVSKFKIKKDYRFAIESIVLANDRGFEPPTFWSVARRSIQLS